MRENMRYAHYWQICARICDRVFAISWHACLIESERTSRVEHNCM